MTNSQYGVVFTTASSQNEATTIAAALIKAKLAACINIFPVHSVYTWQGKVESEDEWQLIIKADLTQFAAIEAKIRAVHSYDVPELIALPIVQGSEPYLQWIGEQTGSL